VRRVGEDILFKLTRRVSNDRASDIYGGQGKKGREIAYKKVCVLVKNIIKLALTIIGIRRLVPLVSSTKQLLLVTRGNIKISRYKFRLGVTFLSLLDALG
jgi:hypothetical protein